MNNYNLTKMATQMFFSGNIAQLDDAGLPSILVYIPAFKLSDVLTGGDDSTHPAFIVNGKEIPGFYYSKYQNVVHNGAAYSLPAEDPQTGITFDAALAVCEARRQNGRQSLSGVKKMVFNLMETMTTEKTAAKTATRQSKAAQKSPELQRVPAL